MIVDCDRYRNNYKYIEELIVEKTNEELLDASSYLALGTGVPIIVVLCFIREIRGSFDALDKKIQKIVEFYKVDEIKGERTK